MSAFAFMLAALLAASAPAAASPSAGCRFPTLNLGSFIAGNRSLDNFGKDQGGGIQVQGANRYHAMITGCDAAATYKLTTGTSAPVRVTNGGDAVYLVPFIVAVNGTILPTAVDLTRPNELVLRGNPDLEIVVALTTQSIALKSGHYNGGFMVQFIDP